jgi:hypothetical protein
MYAYLSVLVDDCDVVVFPDGATTVVARGEGAQTAGTWTVPPADARALSPDPFLERRRAEHKAWSERLDAALTGGSIMANRLLREAFIRDTPEPAIDAAAGGAEPAEAAPRVLPERWWRALVELESGNVVRWLAPAGDPLPRTAIAGALSELSGRGWSLRHVSEDRRAVHDDEDTRTEVTGAWFLLEQA